MKHDFCIPFYIKASGGGTSKILGVKKYGRGRRRLR